MKRANVCGVTPLFWPDWLLREGKRPSVELLKICMSDEEVGNREIFAIFACSVILIRMGRKMCPYVESIVYLLRKNHLSIAALD